jgi:hypothetical protein
MTKVDIDLSEPVSEGMIELVELVTGKKSNLKVGVPYNKQKKFLKNDMRNRRD